MYRKPKNVKKSLRGMKRFSATISNTINISFSGYLFPMKLCLTRGVITIREAEFNMLNATSV